MVILVPCFDSGSVSEAVLPERVELKQVPPPTRTNAISPPTCRPCMCQCVVPLTDRFPTCGQAGCCIAQL